MVMVGCKIDMTIKQMDEQLFLKVQMNDGQERKTKNAMENEKTTYDQISGTMHIILCHPTWLVSYKVPLQLTENDAKHTFQAPCWLLYEWVCNGLTVVLKQSM